MAGRLQRDADLACLPDRKATAPFRKRLQYVVKVLKVSSAVFCYCLSNGPLAAEITYPALLIFESVHP